MRARDPILVDIGDEPSIGHISTFTEHTDDLAEIAPLAARAGSCCMLLDESGAGTDPAEGAALASAC